MIHDISGLDQGKVIDFRLWVNENSLKPVDELDPEALAI
jgi:hypothetical protein